jgi:hypothetical protein
MQPCHDFYKSLFMLYFIFNSFLMYWLLLFNWKGQCHKMGLKYNQIVLPLE